VVRPRRRRRVRCRFGTTFFKPAGVPKHNLEEVILSIDEIEAIRLSDYEGLYQADAAEGMGVSRQTLGNTLKSARKKIADALINGKSIKLGGGIVEYHSNLFSCQNCGKQFENDAFPIACPSCSCKDVIPTQNNEGEL